MKLLPALFATILLSQFLPAQSPAPSPAAAPLAAEERAFAIKYLTTTRDELLAATKGLSAAQLAFKAAPERWSIFECLEHIALSEPAIFGMAKKTLEAPADPAKRAAKKFDDQGLIKAITDRSGKFPAPERLVPSGKFATAAAAIAAFVEQRNQEIQYLETTKDPLRSHIGEHPALGPVDALQLILLNAAHGKRHTLQIEEVKAAQGYPKS